MKGYEHQWWAINGRDLMMGLQEVARGTDPETVYAEMYANAAVTPVEDEERVHHTGGDDA